MVETPPTTEPHLERPGPAEFRDPLVRREMQKAAVWFGMGLAILGVITLGQPLLLIVGGAIFAVLLDGGVRLLGRYLPIQRGWRLLSSCILGFGFFGWVFWFAGTTIAAQFEALRDVVAAQFDRLMAFVASLGLCRGQADRLRDAAARRRRSPDERGRKRHRRGRERDRDDGDRHLSRVRAPAVRSRHGLDAS